MPAGTADLYNRLDNCGLRPVAERFRDEIRDKRKAAGDDRRTASETATREMWEAFRPAVERLETQKAPPKTSAPQRLKGIDAAKCDPNYPEETPIARQLRDGLAWVALNWARVIEQTENGPTAKLEAASTPPPNGFALFVLEAYALAPLEKRLDLVGRALTLAKTDDDPDGSRAAAATSSSPGATALLDAIA